MVSFITLYISQVPGSFLLAKDGGNRGILTALHGAGLSRGRGEDKCLKTARNSKNHTSRRFRMGNGIDDLDDMPLAHWDTGPNSFALIIALMSISIHAVITLKHDHIAL